VLRGPEFYYTVLNFRWLTGEPRKILLVGLILRESFSSWTGHPFDFELWVRLGFWVDHGLNPYKALPIVPGLSFANIFGPGGNSVIAYLPFWPFITAAMYLLYTVVGFGDRLVYYFLLKQPIIISDILVGYMIYRYVMKRSPSHASWAMKFWIFSPITIILSAIWGMFDSVALVFIMMALLLEDGKSRSLLAGMATFAKSLPVFFAAPLTLRKITRPWTFIISLAIPALLTLSVLYVTGWGLTYSVPSLSSTFVKGGETMSPWDVLSFLLIFNLVPQPPSWFLSIAGSIWIPVTVGATLLCLRRFGFRTDYGIIISSIFIYSSFLVSRYSVNEQYSVYLIAFAAIDVAIWHPENKRLLILISASVMGYLLANNFLLVRFLAPVFPGWQMLENQLSTMFGAQRYAFKLIFAMLFGAFNIMYMKRILKYNPLGAKTEYQPDSAKG
jgi:Gpi18-like mannosyltransferase